MITLKWKKEKTAPVEHGDEDGWQDILKTYKVA